MQTAKSREYQHAYIKAQIYTIHPKSRLYIPRIIANLLRRLQQELYGSIVCIHTHIYIYISYYLDYIFENYTKGVKGNRVI